MIFKSAPKQSEHEELTMTCIYKSKAFTPVPLQLSLNGDFSEALDIQLIFSPTKSQLISLDGLKLRTDENTL